MNPKKEHQKVLADQLIKNLAKRNMEGFYCTSADQACKLASSYDRAGFLRQLGWNHDDG